MTKQVRIKEIELKEHILAYSLCKKIFDSFSILLPFLLLPLLAVY